MPKPIAGVEAVEGPFKIEHNTTFGQVISEPHHAGGRRTICTVRDASRAIHMVNLANKAAVSEGWNPKATAPGMDSPAETQEHSEPADTDPA